eukprot:scaffold1395_cov152-Amphora_coffeaeformis.AAC.22
MKRSRVTMEEHRDAEEIEEKDWEELIPQDTAVKQQQPSPATTTATTEQQSETTSSSSSSSSLDNVVVTAAQQLIALYQQRLWSAHQKRTLAQGKFSLLHDEREKLDIKFHNPDLIFRNSYKPLTDDEYDACRKALAAARKATEDLFAQALQEENDLHQQITTVVGAAHIQQHQHSD